MAKWDKFITKCDKYYKVQRLLQIALVQGGEGRRREMPVYILSYNGDLNTYGTPGVK